MRAAQSRLGVISSLDSARRRVAHCVDAVPVSAQAIKVVAAAVAGLAGAGVLRSLFSFRRSDAPVAAAPAPQQRRAGRYLLAEMVVALLLPACRRYLLGELPPDSRVALAFDKLLKKGN